MQNNEEIEEKVQEEQRDTINNSLKDESKSSLKLDNEMDEEKDLKEKVEKQILGEQENKIDEETVIEKIKNFISKIISMQEEVENFEKDDDKVRVKKEKFAKEIEKDKSYLLEYYDLPYRYNETIVKILAQTPKKLFVYWDISDNDRQKYIDTFGKDFFEKTYPVLLVYNEDKKYIKEIPINDFANSWYIEIDDSKTKYKIQLGRKFKIYPTMINMEKIAENHIILKTDYLPFADSNTLEAPNDHVLLEKLPRYIVFRNVKTNQEIAKEIGTFKDTFGNNYNVKEFYNDIYKEEIEGDIFDMANPSSNLSSSNFK